MDPREPIVDAYTSQEYTKCLSLLEASPSEITSQTDMQILQASCLININGRSGEAHQILDKILELEPENGLAFYGKGLAFLKESNLEKSFENFNRAAELDTTGVISKAQIMKLKTEEMLKNKRTSNRLSGKQNKENAAPITCEICKRSFAQVFSLNRHKLIHSGERPHKCSLCNFGFVQKSDLQRHMSVHNENADFPCQSCEKKFKSKKNLSLHLMTHSVDRPFKCEICGKDFKYRRLMKLHQIIHSKRKKYNCDFCEKIFVTKPSLKAHVMMHINRNNKEGVRLSSIGGIVENFVENSGMDDKIEEQKGQNLTDVNITSKTEPNPAKAKKYSKKKLQILESSNQNEMKDNPKKSRGRPPKDAKKLTNVINSKPQNQQVQTNLINKPETTQNSGQIQTLSTSLQKLPQALRNSTRIQNRNSLGTKRNLIKTNPNSLRIRRGSLDFDKNTASIQQKLTKVKNNLSQNQKNKQVAQMNGSNNHSGTSSVSVNPDQLFSTSASSFSDLFPQISLISNNAQESSKPNVEATRFSLGKIELPSSLQIRPIPSLQGSKFGSTEENSSQLNLIPPTRFINPNSPITLSPMSTMMSTPQPQASIISALADPRISAIFSNPQISVAVTSTSSSTLNANSNINSNSSVIDTKWPIATTLEVQPQQEQHVLIKDIKLEPMEVAENLSNHDSLFSSENEHPNEWNLFFKSLMHDLTKMDERQRRKFKQNTFMLIDDILQ